MTNNTDGSNQSSRQRWMGLLARAKEDYFNQIWNELSELPGYDIIKPSEAGMVMVRGRAGGAGQPFNLGEMTVTRCSVRLQDGTVGHGYVRGRQYRFAEKAALVDALMQGETYHQMLEANLISKLEEHENKCREKRSKKVAATKVDFFTMVRGED